MNDLGAQGYSFVPGSVAQAHWSWSIVVMERAPRSSARYQFRIFSPRGGGSSTRFEREAANGQENGFRVVFHGATGEGPSTPMEKRLGDTESGEPVNESHHFLDCSTKSVPKKVREETDRGYAPLLRSMWWSASDINHVLWLQKVSDGPLRAISVESKSGNPVPQKTALDDFLKEINAAAGEGLRMSASPAVFMYPAITFHAEYVWTFGAAMSQSAEPGKVTYRLVYGDTLPDLAERVNAAADEGYRAVPNGLVSDVALLMEKPE